MKQIRLLLLAFFILLAALLALSISAGDGVLARSLAQNGAPQVVSYQGRVTVDGSPYNGSDERPWKTDCLQDQMFRGLVRIHK